MSIQQFPQLTWWGKKKKGKLTCKARLSENSLKVI